MKMPRAPFQVSVIPFRRHADRLEFALLRRADARYWQPIAGGGDDDETPAQAARRESTEEAGIPLTLVLHPLQTMTTVPISCIDEQARGHWDPHLLVIPSYTFAVDCKEHELKLSEEHLELCWVDYERAAELLHWDSDKVGLWELRERIHRGLMPAAV